MLFTLARCNKTVQSDIDIALSRSMVFDDAVSFEDAKNDWGKLSLRCRAVCGTYANGKLNTGQVQGISGGRHYVATAGYVASNNYTQLTGLSFKEMGIELGGIVPKSLVSTIPTFGGGGYLCPDTTMLVFCTGKQGTYLFTTSSAPRSYSIVTTPNGTRVPYTSYSKQGFCYTNYRLLIDGTKLNAGSSTSSTLSSSLGTFDSFFGFLSPGYSSASWSTYYDIWNNPTVSGNTNQIPTTQNTLAANGVTPSSVRSYPVYLGTSEAAEGPIYPKWSAMISTLADARVFFKFDFAPDGDVTPIQMVPGDSSVFTVNKDKVSIKYPKFLTM